MKKKLFKSLLLSCTLALTVPTLAFAGNWKQDFNGWWYQHENGNYPVNSWMNQNGTWYHFNEAGYMQTGWIFDQGTWYYLKPSGAMASDEWIGNYYLNACGAMAVNIMLVPMVHGSPDTVKVNGFWIPTVGGIAMLTEATLPATGKIYTEHGTILTQPVIS